MSRLVTKSALLWFLGYVFVIYTSAYFIERTRQSTNQQRIIQAQVSELDRRFEQLTFIPKLLSDDSTIINVLLEPSSETTHLANLRLAKVQIDSGLDFAFVMDENGVTIASSNWDQSVSFVGENYSFRPYFKEALQGQTSTYFAVGATTGIPGYFIAEPVFINESIEGVVVTKMALTAPVETWKEYNFDTVILDEYGVVILASDPQMLFKASRTISEREIRSIERERRYSVQELDSSQSANQFSRYHMYSSNLVTEPWQYVTLVLKRTYHLTALYTTTLLSILAFAVYLLVRSYRQQRDQVASEQRHSRELEGRVKERSLELEKAQDQLITQSNFAMLGRMSAAINHEINQPLASLRLNMASLRKLVENPVVNAGEIENTIIESDRTTKRIGLVIATLRNYSRNNAIRVKPVQVHTLIADVVETIKTERPITSQHLVVKICDHPLIVAGDNVLVQQALLNLLYNAMDAVMRLPEPCIELSVSGPISHDVSDRSDAGNREIIDNVASKLERAYITISVEDNGGGVPLEMVPMVFEPFSTGKEHDGGLGLGLTIARQIAESHKGKLLYSNTPTGGRFSLQLPAH